MPSHPLKSIGSSQAASVASSFNTTTDDSGATLSDPMSRTPAIEDIRTPLLMRRTGATALGHESITTAPISAVTPNHRAGITPTLASQSSQSKGLNQSWGKGRLQRLSTLGRIIREEYQSTARERQLDKALSQCLSAKKPYDQWVALAVAAVSKADAESLATILDFYDKHPDAIAKKCPYEFIPLPVPAKWIPKDLKKNSLFREISLTALAAYYQSSDSVKLLSTLISHIQKSDCFTANEKSIEYKEGLCSAVAHHHKDAVLLISPALFELYPKGIDDAQAPSSDSLENILFTAIYFAISAEEVRGNSANEIVNVLIEDIKALNQGDVLKNNITSLLPDYFLSLNVKPGYKRTMYLDHFYNDQHNRKETIIDIACEAPFEDFLSFVDKCFGLLDSFKGKLSPEELLQFKQSFFQKNLSGKSFLHRAFQADWLSDKTKNSMPIKRIARLVTSKLISPEVMKIQDVSGNTPLHCLIENRTIAIDNKLELIQALASSGSISSALTENKDGNTPLHLLMLSFHDLIFSDDSALEQVTIEPESLKKTVGKNIMIAKALMVSEESLDQMNPFTSQSPKELLSEVLEMKKDKLQSLSDSKPWAQLAIAQLHRLEQAIVA